jgi:phosphoribosylformylglycinamidine (FGAM) synthase PurS component
LVEVDAVAVNVMVVPTLADPAGEAVSDTLTGTC